MAIKNVEMFIRAHPFFRELEEEHLKTLAGCGSGVSFPAGRTIFRQGEPADQFYLLESGKVAVTLESADRGGVTIQTIEKGGVLGWSWIFPPYVWFFDAKAIEATDALALDARCIRGQCERDHHLGYELMKRFSGLVIDRLQATRVQLMDLYGPGGKTR
jgi:CRP/FNR family transcriptional regulator, cyclic AMP receptor protein